MTNVNLIPLYRRVAQARRRHTRAWTILCCAYCGFLALVLTGGYIKWAAPVHPIASDIAKADQTLGDLEKSLAAARAQIDELTGRLDAGKSATQHPDWSILLALISETLGDDCVLEKCQLQRSIPMPPPAPAAPVTVKPAPKIKPAPPQPIWTLTASGVGRDPQSVSQFILRLESAGLFERVTLLKTARDGYRDREATGFDLECVLKSSSAPAAPAPTKGGAQ